MDSSQEFSGMFKVDQSQSANIEERLQYLFDKDKKILIDGQKRKVIYGRMEQKNRSIYEVIEPYFWKMATATGETATQAGIGLYNAISNGLSWVYRKLMDEVIPYTKQEIPKLLLVIKKQKNKLQSSDSFEVLEIEDDEYQKIEKKAHNGKKRIIVPFDPNGEDPEFVKFMENQNYSVHNSFPIDLDSQAESENFIIPSGRFEVVYEEVLKKNMQMKSSEFELEMAEQNSLRKQFSQKEERQENRNEKDEQRPIEKVESKQKKAFQQVEDYKKIEKNVFKLKNCYIFELEGKNSIEYDLMDGIERDEQTHVGYLLPFKNNKSNNHENLNELDEEDHPFQEIKKPDTTRNVRVQVPQVYEKIQKVEERNVELC